MNGQKCCRSNIKHSCGIDMSKLTSNSTELTTLGGFSPNYWKRCVFLINFKNNYNAVAALDPLLSITTFAQMKSHYGCGAFGDNCDKYLETSLEELVETKQDVDDKVMECLKYFSTFTKIRIIEPKLINYTEAQINSVLIRNPEIEGIIDVTYSSVGLAGADASCMPIGRPDGHTIQGTNRNVEIPDKGFYLFHPFNSKFLYADDGINFIQSRLINDGTYDRMANTMGDDIFNLSYNNIVSQNITYNFSRKQNDDKDFTIVIKAEPIAPFVINPASPPKIKISPNNTTFGYSAGQIINFTLINGVWTFKSNLLKNFYNGVNFNIKNFKVSSILHEFCHCLGMVHTHQIELGNPIVWNEEAVKADYISKGSTATSAITNTINRFSNLAYPFISYDEKSIMMYEIPKCFILRRTDGKKIEFINATDTFSAGDRKALSTVYPMAFMNPRVLNNPKSFYSLNFYNLCIYFLFLISIILLLKYFKF